MEPRYYLAWATDEAIRARGANGGFVTALLVSALENDFIDLALVVKKKSVYEGVPVLTDDPELVKESAGSLHGVPWNLAKLLLGCAPDKRVGVPTKPCDARGIIELAKRWQITLDNVYLIGLNCGGTVHPLRMREVAAELYGLDPDTVLKEEITGGKLIFRYEDEDGTTREKGLKIDELEQGGRGRRDACKACMTKIPAMADLACGNWGVPKGEQKTFVEVLTEKGVAILKNALNKNAIKIEDATEQGIALRTKIERAMQELAARWNDELDLLAEKSPSERLAFYTEQLQRCIHCGACKAVCPVCACDEDAKCLDLNDEQDAYAISLYNLLRILHLMDSCIHCGQCEEVCPLDIPLTLIHRRFSERMQAHLDYKPGMDVMEMPPYQETKLRWPADAKTSESEEA
ncbi:MAG: Coenzyme F420 hydrogenase/dehydrogenase, beta subunit C-terminal domain [Candidatus Methanospirareceae archaeon]